MFRLRPAAHRPVRSPNLILIAVAISIACRSVVCNEAASLLDNSVLGEQPRVIDVSAMCAADSITGQFLFNVPFGGKIYSARYANIHECIYYNTYGENMILFTVPNYKCGTVVQRGADNIINHIENEVYVQFDKETQTSGDKRFLFICDRVDYRPPFTTQAWSYRGTIQASQTVVVQTLEPTKVTADGRFVSSSGSTPLVEGGAQPYVYMEIQEGDGPNNAPVHKPVHLGDTMTLVVTGKGSAGSQFDMFVHSCYASDGSGQTKIQLTDQSGCTAKSSVAGAMSRVKTGLETTYYLPLKAFKFPSSDDVYFSCAVELCTTCIFPELCATGLGVSVGNRTRRKTPLEEELEPEPDSINVHDYVKIFDSAELDEYFNERLLKQTTLPGCYSRWIVIVLLVVSSALLTALIGVSIFAVYQTHFRKRS